jgi:quercetin dioxygenase-like cupin family protein
VKHHDHRIVLIAMRAGIHMMEHRAAGAISIHVLSGRVRVHVATRTIDIAGGQLAALDRSLSHDVEACDDSTVLLSVALNPGEGA